MMVAVKCNTLYIHTVHLSIVLPKKYNIIFNIIFVYSLMLFCVHFLGHIFLLNLADETFKIIINNKNKNCALIWALFLTQTPMNIFILFIFVYHYVCNFFHVSTVEVKYDCFNRRAFIALFVHLFRHLCCWIQILLFLLTENFLFVCF